MRLTRQEHSIIKNIITRFIPDAEVYLFGSRTHRAAKGGDIDILVIGKKNIGLGTTLKIKIALKRHLGDQKIDLLYQRQGHLTPFASLAKMEGILL